MHIKRVEIENIKSHVSAAFDFERGSTAITGENGAGKTTIIEAIAWTLFNVLDYKKDDFLRRGAKRGWAKVTFESSLDEREYTVYRDTGTSYYVLDPRLETRIAEKKEEVTRFLWQHLGVEPGTDLEALFKQAIGVPQGTFTSIFLAPVTERKRTFDTLLKVEEYRRGADELLKTARYVDHQIADVNVKIARAEGEISRIGSVEIEFKEMSSQTGNLSSELEKFVREAEAKAESVTHLDAVEEQIAAAAKDLQAARSANEKAALVFAQRKAELDRSREAADLILTVTAEATRHSESLLRLKELERERVEREKVRLELAKVETAIVNVSAEQKHLLADIEKIQNSHREIADLKPKAEVQHEFEKNVALLREKLARIDAITRNVQSLDERLTRLREEFRVNAEQLKAAHENATAAAELESLQTKDTQIVREMAALNASLERDEAFQREIKNGLCPILSEKCLNLKEGQTLESFVTSQFGELRMKIDLLKTEQSATTFALRTSRDAEKSLAQIPVLDKRSDEIKAEGSRLKGEKEALEKETESRAEIETELNRLQAELKALGNPTAKIAFLEAEGKREIEIREKLSTIEKNLERLESDRKIGSETLEAYKDLDQHWREATDARDATVEAYRSFLVHEPLANRLKENEAEFEKASKELAGIAELLNTAEAAFESAGKHYDRERHLSERAAFAESQRQQTETKTRLDLASKRVTELSAELDRLKTIRASMQDEFREKERLEKVAEVTDFIRATLKEAAPLVARNYVYHVSVEAGQMYREITGNADQTLKWAEDYGIVLEEGGYERPFQSLSGGEQMAAALSVRLALLKQLSDIRIAFFDEPTTNMDEERRENLAQQIGNIRHFDQLFVISHDDTFEGYMDHEISLIS